MNKLSTICPHFGACSGCTLKNNLDAPPIWAEVINFFKVAELVAGELYGWRTKAKLAVRGRFREPKIGLFRSGTHEVEPILDCLAHHPSINRAVKILEGAIQEEKVFIYDEKKGILRYVQCLVDLATGKVQLVLVVQARSPSLERFCEALLKSDLWHSIWLNVQPAKTNAILGEEWIHVWGEKFLWQELCGQKFPFHPGAFSQAHWTLFESLAKQVIEWVPDGSKLLEIYAGVGMMGILATSKALSVDLVENNLHSYLSFQEMNASARYHLGDAKSATLLLERADCVIVDPPRKGIDPVLLESMKSFSGTLIYVSCDFQSFVRDAKSLIESGWILQEGKGYLLFPGTNHVETTALFRRSISK
jgi:tRNA/tmRNA/rRNA uracil-C5-methylase (TrmA/RlmC/RlmD family)